MKTRSISFIFSLLLVFLFKGMILAQDPIGLFNEAFPELQNELKFDEKIKDLSPKAVVGYRNVLQKLDDANGDLVAQEIGALSDENAKVFKYKSLKKVKDLSGLKELVKENKHKIKEYMGDKTQYGADSLECIQNMALFQQTSKQGKWDAAYQYWHTLFHYYQRATKTTYSKGSDLIEYKIGKEKDATKKNQWIDTLFKLYDQRVKFFGDDPKYPKGYILGLKAIDMIKYRPEMVDKAYPVFEESVNLQKTNSDDAVLLSYMQATIGMFEVKKIDAAAVVDNYSKIIDLLEQKKKSETTQQAIDGVNALFLKSDASTCKELIPAFEKKFKANQNDLDLLKKIAIMLDGKECTDSQLYFDVALQMNKLEPSALSNYAIAMMYLKQKEFGKASSHLEEAIKLETEDTLKAKYYYKLALVSNELGKKSEARSQALKAVSYKSNFGAPYILIATMYASSGCSSLVSVEGELPGVAYWAAVDKLVKAKSVDPSMADDVNKLIGRYSGAFPNAEKGFMIGVTQGRTVTVGCWISETTTARF